MRSVYGRLKSLPADAKHIVNLHPDWINKTHDGQTHATGGIYLDPGVPAARDHIAKVMLDIATALQRGRHTVGTTFAIRARTSVFRLLTLDSLRAAETGTNGQAEP